MTACSSSLDRCDLNDDVDIDIYCCEDFRWFKGEASGLGPRCGGFEKNRQKSEHLMTPILGSGHNIRIRKNRPETIQNQGPESYWTQPKYSNDPKKTGTKSNPYRKLNEYPKIYKIYIYIYNYNNIKIISQIH